MSLTSLRCPSCGAEVLFSGDVIGRCPYCDSQLHFDDLADKVELERLRAENNEYERQETAEELYSRKLKNWRHGSAAFLDIEMLLTIAGFLILSFASAYAGIAPILAAVLLFMIVPPLMGALYPTPVRYGKPVRNTGKKIGMTAALYGLGIFTFIIAVITAAVIAVAAGYESKADKSSRKVSVSKNSDDCDMLADKWCDVAFSADTDDVMEYYELQCPDEVWERDKDSENNAMMVEYQKAHMRAVLESSDIRVKSVVKLNALSDKELLDAEAYFNRRYGIEVTVMQGYEYDIAFTVKDRETDEKREHDDFICVVKLKGEDWKIIPAGSEKFRQE